MKIIAIFEMEVPNHFIKEEIDAVITESEEFLNSKCISWHTSKVK